MTAGRTLAVILYGQHAANLEQTAGGQHALTYTDTSAATPVSLSMPVAPVTYTHARVEPFLEGLLPDREETRQAMGRELGVNGRNPFSLLSRMGLDCAGAVQFCPPADVPDVLARQGGLDPVDDQWIGDRLRVLRSDSGASWKSPRERWSLAGAQAKFAIRQEGGRWFEPTGAEPTTHIVKPGVAGLRHQALNEHVCLDTATRTGLRAAWSAFTEFDGEPALVVERYDRRRDGSGALVRLHQEDACQASSVSPRDKYESDGGPRAVDIVTLLRMHSRPRDAGRNVTDFVDALVFSYLIEAPDAHAKNYSILLVVERVRLAPIYDVASAAPYDSTEQTGLRQAAMAVGRERRFGRVGRANWERFATEAKLDPEEVVDRVRVLAAKVPDAMSDAFSALASSPAGTELRGRMLDRIAQHCASTIARLDDGPHVDVAGRKRTAGPNGRVRSGVPEGGQYTVRARQEPDVIL